MEVMTVPSSSLAEVASMIVESPPPAAKDAATPSPTVTGKEAAAELEVTAPAALPTKEASAANVGTVTEASGHGASETSAGAAAKGPSAEAAPPPDNAEKASPKAADTAADADADADPLQKRVVDDYATGNVDSGQGSSPQVAAGEETAEAETSGFGALDSLLGWSLDHQETDSPRDSPVTVPANEADPRGPNCAVEDTLSDGGAAALGAEVVDTAGVSVDGIGVGEAAGAPLQSFTTGIVSTEERLESLKRRLEGRQSLVEGRLRQSRARLAKQELLTGLWLSARTGSRKELEELPAMVDSISGHIDAFRRLESRAGTLLHHRKRTRAGRRARGIARSVQRGLRASASVCDPDATDSSSCNSSESEEEVDTAPTARTSESERKRRRKVQSMWDSDRAEIGWRWNWLDLRLNGIRDQICEYTALYDKLRQSKKCVELEEPGSDVDMKDVDGDAARSVDGEGEVIEAPTDLLTVGDAVSCESAARTRPIALNFERRQIIDDRINVPTRPHNPVRAVSAPLVHSDRNAIRARSALLDRGFHLVLSLPSDAPESVLSRARAHRKILRQQQLNRQKQAAGQSTNGQRHKQNSKQQTGKQSQAQKSEQHKQKSEQHKQKLGHQKQKSEQHKQKSEHQKQEGSQTKSKKKHGNGASGDASSSSSSSKKSKKKAASKSAAAAAPAQAENPDQRISVSVCAIEAPPSSTTPAATPQPSAPASSNLLSRRKKKDNTSIDDIVMPALTPSRFEPLVVKEILTPTWRTAPTTPISAEAGKIGTEATDQIMAADECDEDVTDAAVEKRHSEFEEKERRRALGVPGGRAVDKSSLPEKEQSKAKPHTQQVNIVENRLSSKQLTPSFVQRQWPLTGDDLTAISAKLEPVKEVWPVMSPTGKIQSAPIPAVPPPEPEEKKPAPIKLLFKLARPPPDASK